MTAGPPSSRRRPRPVADAPGADPVVVAKGWLLELLAAVPLEAVAAVPTADLAREAPGLCEAMLDAVRSDAALDRLSPGGDRAALAARAGALAGARSAPDAVAAVEALRAALSQALRTPGAADPALAADLGDRLAHVCAVVAGAALAPGALEQAAAEPTEPEARVRPAPAGVRAVPAPVPEGVVRLDPFASAAAGDLTARQAATEPWAAAITRRLERYADDGRPFGVLAIEVDEVDRLEAVDATGSFAEALEAAERALEAELRPADMLVRERPGRHWLIAPDTTATAARELGERLASAVAARAFHHGLPLAVSIGLAICPDDGTSTDTLLGHADGGVFAARAAGLPVA